jgi:hypothetical protein
MKAHLKLISYQATALVGACAILIGMPSGTHAFPGPFYHTEGRKIEAARASNFSSTTTLKMETKIGTRTVKIECQKVKFNANISLLALATLGSSEPEKLTAEECGVVVSGTNAAACKIVGSKFEMNNVEGRLGYETEPTPAEVASKTFTVPIINGYGSTVGTLKLGTVTLEACEENALNIGYELAGGFIAKTMSARNTEVAAVGQELSIIETIYQSAINPCNGQKVFARNKLKLTFAGEAFSKLEGAFNISITGQNLGLYDE